MSRYNHHHNTGPVLEAAEVWRKKCLEHDGSIFDEHKSLWTTENLNVLNANFVNNLNAGDGNFYQKLKAQLSGGSPASRQLMAEIMWILLLFSASILPATKRESIIKVWSWSGEALFEEHPFFDDAVNGGLGATGVGFNNHRWRELVYLIGIFRALKTMGTQERSTLLTNDPWVFDEWLKDFPDGGNRQMSSILPHLLFPDSFERTSSKNQKWALLSWFEGKPIRDYKRKNLVDIDRALLDLRRKLEKKAGRDIDFYEGGEFSEWMSPPPILKNKAVIRWKTVMQSEFVGFHRFDAPHAEFDKTETDYKLKRTQRLRSGFETCDAPEDYIKAIYQAFGKRQRNPP